MDGRLCDTLGLPDGRLLETLGLPDGRLCDTLPLGRLALLPEERRFCDIELPLGRLDELLGRLTELLERLGALERELL